MKLPFARLRARKRENQGEERSRPARIHAGSLPAHNSGFTLNLTVPGGTGRIPLQRRLPSLPCRRLVTCGAACVERGSAFSFPAEFPLGFGDGDSDLAFAEGDKSLAFGKQLEARGQLNNGMDAGLSRLTEERLDALIVKLANKKTF